LLSTSVRDQRQAVMCREVREVLNVASSERET
jgi:hypothetical protein